MQTALLLLLVFLVSVILLAFVVLIVQLRRRDVLQTTIGSLVPMLVLLVGGIGKPEVNGTAKLHLAISSAFSVDSDTISITTSSSPYTWGIAFLTIAALLLVCILKLKDSPQAISR